MTTFQIVEMTVVAIIVLVGLFSMGTLLALAEPFSAFMNLLVCVSTATG